MLIGYKVNCHIISMYCLFEFAFIIITLAKLNYIGKARGIM